MKKHKKLMITTATAVMAASVAIGTFAWRSISQQQINEKIGEDATGGRVHDDFDGENKDVYAENYADEDGVTVYVRIRLDEYMETGAGAGEWSYDDSGNLNPRTATSLVTGASIDQTGTWQTRTPSNQATTPFAQYWEWKFGGFTIYMPTFNKNKDSLSVDVNGTMQGNGQGGPYSDYYAWSLGESEETDAYYDADDNDFDEGTNGTINVNYTIKKETHIASETKTAEVMTMSEWKAAGSLVGNYWVWDEDGWFYWARPLRPGETTGLLLDEINKIDYLSSKYYYAINVVGQFATAGDWGDENSYTGFYADGSTISDNAKKLLEIITSVVTGKDGNEYVNCGYNIYQRLYDNGSLGSLICAGADKSIGTDDDLTNRVIVLAEDLTVNGTNYGHVFLCPVTGSYKYQAMNVDGDKLLGTSDDVAIYYTGSISDFPDTSKGTLSEQGADTITLNINAVTSSKNHTATIDYNTKTITVQPYDIVDFETTVTLDGTTITNQKVTWKLSQVGSTALTWSENSVNTAQLNVGDNVQAGTTLTLQAVSEEDNRITSDMYQVIVEGPATIVISESGTEVNGTLSASKKESTTFTATVKAADGSDYAVQDVTWTLSGNVWSGTSITQAGVLNIDTGEDPKNDLYITAASVCSQSVLAKIKVNPISIFEGITISQTSTDMVNIDGTDFYVLAHDTANEQYLIFAKEPVTQSTFGSSRQWSTTCNAYTALKAWLDTKQTLKVKAQQTMLYTREDYADYGKFIETTCEIFPLTEADLFGTANHTTNPDSKEYTYNGKQLTTSTTVIGFTDLTYTPSYTSGYWYWLRSPGTTRSNKLGVAAANSKGALDASGDVVNNVFGLRPAMWVKGL